MSHPSLMTGKKPLSTLHHYGVEGLQKEFVVRSVERIDLERRPHQRKNMLLGRPSGKNKASMFHQTGTIKPHAEISSPVPTVGFEHLISVKSFIDMQLNNHSAKSTPLPTGYYGVRRFNSEVALFLKKPQPGPSQNSHFFKLPVKQEALKNSQSIPRLTVAGSTGSTMTRFPKIKEAKLVEQQESWAERPFLNCKSIPKFPNKNQKPEAEGLRELLDQDDTLAAFMKSGKTYHLRDVDFDDKFLNDAILPPERANNLLEKLARDYTPATLRRHKADIALVLSQPFEEIASGFGTDFQQLAQLCCSMLLNDMEEEENGFFNTISIMLQSLQTLIISAYEDQLDKTCARVFTVLKKLLANDSASKSVVSQMFFNSFNRMASKAVTIETSDLREYLHQSLEVVRSLVENEFNTFTAQSTRSHNIDAHPPSLVTPMEGIELFLRHAQHRRAIIEDEYLWTQFSKLMSFLHEVLLQTSFNRIAGTKKQLFTVTYFAVFLSAVKHKSIQTALRESIPGFSAENLIKTLLSLLYVSCKTDSMSTAVKDMFLCCFHNSTKVFSQYVDFVDEEQKIQDYEFYLKVFFGLHFDPDSQFLTVRNLQLAQCLLQFVTQVLECAVLVISSIYRDCWAEMSAVLQAYNQLMERRHPIMTSAPDLHPEIAEVPISTHQKEVEIRKILSRLLEILNKAKPLPRNSGSPQRASKGG